MFSAVSTSWSLPMIIHKKRAVTTTRHRESPGTMTSRISCIQSVYISRAVRAASRDCNMNEVRPSLSKELRNQIHDPSRWRVKSKTCIQKLHVYELSLRARHERTYIGSWMGNTAASPCTCFNHKLFLGIFENKASKKMGEAENAQWNVCHSSL